MRERHINPLNVIKSLSMALELLSSHLSFHHWRVAMIAMEIAEEMKLSYEDSALLLQAALLHDIGAAPSWNIRMKLRLKSQTYKEKKIENRYIEHAYKGYEFLKGSDRFSNIAKIILHHHESWRDSKDDKNIPIQSRILHLADWVDLAIDSERNVLLQAECIRNDVKKMSGRLFMPELVTAFLAASGKESFWLNIVNKFYAETFFEHNEYYRMTMPYTEEDIIDIAGIYANIIDEASGFTYNHSRSVSKIAVFLAEERGFSENEIKDIMIAGLLHDIGKLSIPNSVLEKPSGLNDEEFALMRQHTYYTYRILEQIDGFEQIAQWAAYHHEYLDGSGYPFHYTAENLPMGSRIMAVADIFVALREDRPYRKGLSEDKVLTIMREMVNNNKIDKRLVKIISQNYKTVSFLVKGSGTGQDIR